MAAEQVVFRRPTRADALALAREEFLAGERVEMQTLAARLGIGRTTLYRWVGEREGLLGEVFGGLVDEWLAVVEPEVESGGVEEFLTLLRRFLEFAAGSEPLTEFAQREPALALRTLTDADGPVTKRSDAVLRRLLDAIEPPLAVPTEVVSAIGLTARTLVWANIATGHAPDIDGALQLARTLLANCARPS